MSFHLTYRQETLFLVSLARAFLLLSPLCGTLVGIPQESLPTRLSQDLLSGTLIPLDPQIKSLICLLLSSHALGTCFHEQIREEQPTPVHTTSREPRAWHKCPRNIYYLCVSQASVSQSV